MAGIFGKIRTLVLGNVNDILDAAIDLNSTAAIKQHIRDLEEARDSLGGEVAVASGRVASLAQQIATFKAKMETTTGNIQLIMGDGDESNDNLAEPLMASLIGLEKQMADRVTEQKTAADTEAALKQAHGRVAEKHREMLERVRALEQMERSTRAKEKAAGALKSAGRLANMDAGASVDNVEQRMRDNSAVADAKLKQALGDLGDGVDMSVMAAKAKQRIAARRQQIAAEAKS